MQSPDLVVPICASSRRIFAAAVAETQTAAAIPSRCVEHGLKWTSGIGGTLPRVGGGLERVRERTERGLRPNDYPRARAGLDDCAFHRRTRLRSPPCEFY